MKKVGKQSCQGDVMITKVDALPEGLKEAKPEHRHGVDAFVVAHSETMHDHIVEATPNVQLFLTNDVAVSYLKVNKVAGFSLKKTPIKIEHKRDFDTHETLVLDQVGIYRINRQKEFTPEGWNLVMD